MCFTNADKQDILRAYYKLDRKNLRAAQMYLELK